MEIKLTAKDVIEHGSVHEYMWTNYPNAGPFKITHVGKDGNIVVCVTESENDKRVHDTIDRLDSAGFFDNE